MIDLRAIRLAAELSQTALAKELGLSERSGRQTVGEIEARQDWLLSSVAAYVRAAGGTAELVVTVNGEELHFPIV